VTSQPPSAAAYFMLLFISQTLKFHSPVSPDPLNARSLRLLGFPKSPPLKNPRSATDKHAERFRTCLVLVEHRQRLARRTSSEKDEVSGETGEFAGATSRSIDPARVPPGDEVDVRASSDARSTSADAEHDQSRGN